jgi:hypothetical protein
MTVPDRTSQAFPTGVSAVRVEQMAGPTGSLGARGGRTARRREGRRALLTRPRLRVRLKADCRNQLRPYWCPELLVMPSGSLVRVDLQSTGKAASQAGSVVFRRAAANSGQDGGHGQVSEPRRSATVGPKRATASASAMAAITSVCTIMCVQMSSRVRCLAPERESSGFPRPLSRPGAERSHSFGGHSRTLALASRALPYPARCSHRAGRRALAPTPPATGFVSCALLENR